MPAGRGHHWNQLGGCWMACDSRPVTKHTVNDTPEGDAEDGRDAVAVRRPGELLLAPLVEPAGGGGHRPGDPPSCRSEHHGARADVDELGSAEVPHAVLAERAPEAAGGGARLRGHHGDDVQPHPVASAPRASRRRASVRRWRSLPRRPASGRRSRRPSPARRTRSSARARRPRRSRARAGRPLTSSMVNPPSAAIRSTQCSRDVDHEATLAPDREVVVDRLDDGGEGRARHRAGDVGRGGHVVDVGHRRQQQRPAPGARHGRQQACAGVVAAHRHAGEQPGERASQPHRPEATVGAPARRRRGRRPPSPARRPVGPR